MSGQRVSPSPLAGEGGLRRRRRTGEGARSLTGAARQLRARMTDAELRFWNNDVLQNLEGVLTGLAEQLDSTPHPSSCSRETPPSPARGEGKQGAG